MKLMLQFLEYQYTARIYEAGSFNEQFERKLSQAETGSNHPINDLRLSHFHLSSEVDQVVESIRKTQF